MDLNGACEVYLFGDLATAFADPLRRLLQHKRNATLQSFFHQVGQALQKELSQLSLEEQRWFPSFTDLVDLMTTIDGSFGKHALDSALLCTYQLGVIINSEDSLPSERSVAIGVCTGAFAASALAASKSMFELISSGTRAVLMAFRVGLESLRMQQSIDVRRDGQSQSWSLVVNLTESKAEEVLRRFRDETALPPTSQPFVSAVSPSTLTISGPPAVLKQFVQSFALKAHPIPIYSPYHAPHLYGSELVDRLAHFSVPTASTRHMNIVSTATGKSDRETDFNGLLRTAVIETLREQIRWTECLGPESSLIMACPGAAFVVRTIASDAGNLLCSALQKAGAASTRVVSPSVDNNSFTSCSASLHDAKIAIVGFSGRYPEAASNEDLWQVLEASQDCYRTIPEDRFDWKAHYDPTGKKKNTSRVKYGCFINEPGVFDARFFNLSPREAEGTDPAQRLALMSAYEAMEMSGFVPDRTPSTRRDRVGVFFGVTSDDWREVNSGQDVDTYFIPGGNRAFHAGRISFFFRFCGPSMSIDTACSSSFASISTACGYLRRGDCDSAIAGGTNVLTNPDNFAGLDRGHFLSTTGNCNPFDNEASGYCRADGVGAVVLKRLDDAVADNDPIFGVIAGTATNHCGQTVSITRPHDGDQLSLFRRILSQSGTNPLDVSYVEMHGTGTQAGDAAEMQSVLGALGCGDRRGDAQYPRPLYLGAVKANVGHSESASGVTALIKVLMMMQRDRIPPQRKSGRLNTSYPADLSQRNVHVAFQGASWRRKDHGGLRKAFLNNFSAAGGNTAVLLEDAPNQPKLRAEGPDDPRTAFPVTISAKTTKALANNLQALQDHLRSSDAISLPSLSYTTTARRMHHQFRIAVTASDLSQLQKELGRLTAGVSSLKAIPPTPPKIIHMFSGQGHFYPGIAFELFDKVKLFREKMCHLDALARLYRFPSPLQAITGEMKTITATDTDAMLAQVSLVCIQMALSDLWAVWTGKPSMVIGHSLGEYAALYAAGVLSASDAIYLAGRRAKLLVQHCTKGTHTMLAIKSAFENVHKDVIDAGCEIACVNSPASTVATGPVGLIQALTATLARRSVETIPLDVPYAFHSAQVDPILSEFKAVADHVTFHPPRIPYLSPLLGEVITESNVIDASYLVRATRRRVQFQAAVEVGKESGLVTSSSTWLEIGAHPSCSGMIKKMMVVSGSPALPTLRKDVDIWKVVADAATRLYLAGNEVQWNELHRDFAANLSVLPLPRYRCDLKNYWIQYRHDWTLSKGDAPTRPPIGGALIDRTETADSPAYISSSIHRIIEHVPSETHARLVSESNVHDERLAPIFSGHQVNGVKLCPSSLYADMAFTVVRHMLDVANKKLSGLGLDCSSVSVSRPFIMDDSANAQCLRVEAIAEWNESTVALRFFSGTGNGKELAEHATCLVKIIANQKWLDEWKRTAHLVTSRVSSLEASAAAGTAHQLNRGIVYKLFSSLVDYEPRYQGMERVVLDSSALEGISRVKFQTGADGFDMNPCWIDSLGHLAGFIMNGNESIADKDSVFINHGWEACRFATSIDPSKVYTSYNRMQLERGTTFVGNTYVLVEDQIVGVIEGVRFQGIKRSALDRVLPRKPRAQVNAAIPHIKADGKAERPQRSQDQTKKKSPLRSQSKSAKAENNTQSSGWKIATLLQIVSQEMQLDEAELELESDLKDMGMDSLLSLTISGRLRDEVGVQVSNSDIMECRTVHALLKCLGDDSTASPGNVETPASRSSLDSSSIDEDADEESSDITSITDPDESNSGLSATRTVYRVIGQEAGVAVDELRADTSLEEIGVDSSLGLTVAGKLSERFGVPVSSSLLTECTTVGDFVHALKRAKVVPQDPAQVVKESKDRHSVPRHPVTARNVPPATSVLLQKPSKTTKCTLFLFPDGAGSAASYLALPDISPAVSVRGLNCPWMKTPQDLRCPLEDYVALFLREIKRIQPHGPYSFGGVSAGGILAYEAAQQLAVEGENVDQLILVDTPDPVGLENPNSRMYDFLNSLGVFGMQPGRAAPAWLRPHFDAFLAMLDGYDVKAFVGSSPPATHIFYARDGMCKSDDDARPEVYANDPREMLWLLNNRTDFSGAGWNSLVSRENLYISVLDDVNHYTIMQPGERICDLSVGIRRALLGS